jgi:hypothetical protein
MSTLEWNPPPGAFILSEANAMRARENYPLSLGKTLKAGGVAKVEPAVDLTTTASTHTNKTLDTLAAVTDLVVGDVYAISGTGIPTGTTFTYTGTSAGTLSAAATASGTGVSMHITKPAGVGPWLVVGDTPAGVSIYDMDATAAALMGSFIARDAEVNLKLLVFPADSDADVVSDLAGLGIVCRN